MGPERPGSSADERLPLQGIAVLIAEDELHLAEEIAWAVAALGGHIVGPAPTTGRALELLADEPTTIGIVDLDLRGEMAFALLDEMIRRNIPVVLATGCSGARIPPRYSDLPRWTKPYLPLSLAAALKPYC